MPDHSPTILLLEDTRTVQNYIRDVLRSLPIKHELFTARKIQEGANIAGERDIDLFLVDIGLPDGNGIDFLCAMSAMHPNARALIITSSPREDHRARARNLGVLKFLEKPIQRKELLEAVTAMLTPESPSVTLEAAVKGDDEPPKRSAGGGFEGTLGGLSPADIIQLKCLSHSTGKIEFSTEDRFGFVWFADGEVIHAEAEHSGGKLAAIEAFQFMVGWKSGTAREIVDESEPPRTINKSWQALLMDATDPSQPAFATC